MSLSDVDRVQLLYAKAMDYAEVAGRSPDARNRANARRWLRRHGFGPMYLGDVDQAVVAQPKAEDLEQFATRLSASPSDVSLGQADSDGRGHADAGRSRTGRLGLAVLGIAAIAAITARAARRARL